MFRLFIVLSSVNESLERYQAKCLFLNYELCMVRPSLSVMNPVELKYYPFMISLNKCTGCCNVISTKICFPKKQKTYMLKQLI